MATSFFYIHVMVTSFFYIYVMATSFFYIYVMATSFFYIYVMATSFFYIYIYIYIYINIYQLTERPVVLSKAIFPQTRTTTTRSARRCFPSVCMPPPHSRAGEWEQNFPFPRPPLLLHSAATRTTQKSADDESGRELGSCWSGLVCARLDHGCTWRLLCSASLVGGWHAVGMSYCVVTDGLETGVVCPPGTQGSRKLLPPNVHPPGFCIPTSQDSSIPGFQDSGFRKSCC